MTYAHMLLYTLCRASSSMMPFDTLHFWGLSALYRHDKCFKRAALHIIETRWVFIRIYITNTSNAFYAPPQRRRLTHYLLCSLSATCSCQPYRRRWYKASMLMHFSIYSIDRAMMYFLRFHFYYIRKLLLMSRSFCLKQGFLYFYTLLNRYACWYCHFSPLIRFSQVSLPVIYWMRLHAATPLEKLFFYFAAIISSI